MAYVTVAWTQTEERKLMMMMMMMTRRARDETAGANMHTHPASRTHRSGCPPNSPKTCAPPSRDRWRVAHDTFSEIAPQDARTPREACRTPVVDASHASSTPARPYATEPRRRARTGARRHHQHHTTTSCASLTTQPAPAPRFGLAWKWAGSIMARTSTYGTG